VEEIEDMVIPVEQAFARLRNLTSHEQEHAADAAEAGAAAADYLHLFALVCFGWMWARMAATAQRQGEDVALHQAKLALARFFITRLLPRTIALEAAIAAGASPIQHLAAALF
jgi:hypothetical protein